MLVRRRGKWKETKKKKVIAEKFLGFIIKSRLAGTHANMQFEELEQVVFFLLHSECKKTVSVLMEIRTFLTSHFYGSNLRITKDFKKKITQLNSFLKPSRLLK